MHYVHPSIKLQVLYRKKMRKDFRNTVFRFFLSPPALSRVMRLLFIKKKIFFLHSLHNNDPFCLRRKMDEHTELFTIQSFKTGNLFSLLGKNVTGRKPSNIMVIRRMLIKLIERSLKSPQTSKLLVYPMNLTVR